MLKRITALFMIGMLVTCLAACNDKTDAVHDHETGVIINHLEEKMTAEVAAAFFDAQKVALYFSGYGSGMYTEGSIEVAGGTYEGAVSTQYDRFSACDTMAELREATEAAFTDELAQTFLDRSVGDMPLFYESDGVLYRFGGYVAQYGAEAELTEIVECRRNGDGSITLSVRATFPGLYGGDADINVEQDYTCIDVGGKYKFTGEFKPLVELAAAEIFG